MSDHVLRRARCLVLEALYEAETSNHDPETVFDRRLGEVAVDDREVTAKRPAAFGREVIRGITASRDELDSRLQPVAPRHPLPPFPWSSEPSSDLRSGNSFMTIRRRSEPLSTRLSSLRTAMAARPHPPS